MHPYSPANEEANVTLLDVLHERQVRARWNPPSGALPRARTLKTKNRWRGKRIESVTISPRFIGSGNPGQQSKPSVANEPQPNHLRIESEAIGEQFTGKTAKTTSKSKSQKHPCGAVI